MPRAHAIAKLSHDHGPLPPETVSFASSNIDVAIGRTEFAYNTVEVARALAIPTESDGNETHPAWNRA